MCRAPDAQTASEGNGSKAARGENNKTKIPVLLWLYILIYICIVIYGIGLFSFEK